MMPLLTVEHPASGDSFLKIEPTETVSFPFWGSIAAFTNTDDANRKNQVVRLGWNAASGGGVVSSSDWAMGMEFESYYAPVSSIRAYEWHLSFVNPSSVIVARPISVFMNRVGPEVHTTFQGSSVSCTGLDGNPFIKATPGWLQLLAGTKLAVEPNNVIAVCQLNAAANGYVTMLQLDASDVTRVGGPNGVKLGGLFQFGTAAQLSSATATHEIQVKDSAGNTFYLLARSA